MKILITAFNKFNNSINNISEDVLNLLPDNPLTKKLLLDTSFFDSSIEIISFIETYNPEYIIMLGEAGNRTLVSLEKVAINYVDARILDNKDQSLVDQLIIDDAPLAFFSKIDLKKIKDSLIDYPIEISYSAGTYVCNYLYYNVLNHIEKNNLSTKALFIHLPKNSINTLFLLETISKIISLITIS